MGDNNLDKGLKSEKKLEIVWKHVKLHEKKKRNGFYGRKKSSSTTNS